MRPPPVPHECLQSLACIPTDPYLQYVWLELKDRGPFNLRLHEALFTVINSRYPAAEAGHLGAGLSMRRGL